MSKRRSQPRTHKPQTSVSEPKNLIDRIIGFRREYDFFADESFGFVRLDPSIIKALNSQLVTISEVDLTRAIAAAEPHKQRVLYRNELEQRAAQVILRIDELGIRMSSRDLHLLRQPARLCCTDAFLKERAELVERAEATIAELQSVIDNASVDDDDELDDLKIFQIEVTNLARPFMTSGDFVLSAAHRKALYTEITAGMNYEELRAKLARIRDLCNNRMVEYRRRRLTANGIPATWNSNLLSTELGIHVEPPMVKYLAQVLDHLENIQRRNAGLERRRRALLECTLTGALESHELEILSEPVNPNSTDTHTALIELLSLMEEIQEAASVLQPA